MSLPKTSYLILNDPLTVSKFVAKLADVYMLSVKTKRIAIGTASALVGSDADTASILKLFNCPVICVHTKFSWGAANMNWTEQERAQIAHRIKTELNVLVNEEVTLRRTIKYDAPCFTELEVKKASLNDLL